MKDASIKNGGVVDKNGKAIGKLVEKDGKMYLYKTGSGLNSIFGHATSSSVIDLQTGEEKEIKQRTYGKSELEDNGFKPVFESQNSNHNGNSATPKRVPKAKRAQAVANFVNYLTNVDLSNAMDTEHGYKGYPSIFLPEAGRNTMTNRELLERKLVRLGDSIEFVDNGGYGTIIMPKDEARLAKFIEKKESYH